jgi:phosphoribosylpyrophosphate synthetase
MKVRFICGYYSKLAHENKQRRPEDYWDAYNFCWAVKYGTFKPVFNIHDTAGNKTQVTKKNFNIVRPTFGKWIDKSATTFSGRNVALVPVPSKDGIAGAKSFRSLDMTNEALKGSTLAKQVSSGLRWKKKLTEAHLGGTRSRALLAPMLDADTSLKGKDIILIDDLVTTGSSMLASADVLAKAGANVLGAVVCGKTIYDLKTPHFGEQEFDLTDELADWTPN